MRLLPFRARLVLSGWLLAVLMAGCEPALAATATWQIKTIDGGSSNDAGKYTSLAIDNNGDFHVGYFDGSRGTLRYAFRPADQDRWYSMDVDASGGFASLAVDSKNRPHFAYAGPSESGLRYAYWDGKRWIKATLDAERINFFMFIRIGPDDLPKISYYHRLHQDGSYALHLKYTRFDGTKWYTETVDPRSATGKFNSLALDRDSNPMISYSDVDAGALRFGRWDGKQWNYAVPDTSQASQGWVGIASSIETDADGNPHIAYIDVTHRRVKYASLVPERGWMTEMAAQMVGKADSIDRVSLKIDKSNQPHIAFHDSGLGNLQYATKTDKGWRVEVVDEGPNVGEYPSLCLDAKGGIWITYYDAAATALKIAHRSSSEATPASQPEKAKR